MKKSILFLSLILSSLLNGQILFDSISPIGSSTFINAALGTELKSDKLYVCSVEIPGSNRIILVYDKHLNIIDTLTATDAGRPNDYFTYPINFNDKLYYIISEDISTATIREYSLHRIENGLFTDSIDLNLDTIANGHPSYATSLNDTSLQLLVNIAPTGPIIDSRILFLDTNFNLTHYFHPPLDSLKTTISRQITAVQQVNDSLWHLYLSNTVALYNPKTNQILEDKKLLIRSSQTYQLPNDKYIVVGTTSFPIKPPNMGSNQPSSLGFYFMDSQANILDTVSFNAFKDTVPFLGINNYSNEDGGGKNSIMYDTNNIYLAGEGYYSTFNTSTPDYRYFHVIKTNLRGNTKWQFIWGGNGDLITFRGIEATKSGGCAIIGTIRRSNSLRSILIKFGPDGNISNVELDAPEDYVAFYPNPVKDKLHYKYLPEANDQYNLEIVDMNGKPVLNVELIETQGSITVQLTKAFYIYSLKDSSGNVIQVGKLLVE